RCPSYRTKKPKPRSRNRPRRSARRRSGSRNFTDVASGWGDHDADMARSRILHLGFRDHLLIDNLVRHKASAFIACSGRSIVCLRADTYSCDARCTELLGHIIEKPTSDPLSTVTWKDTDVRNVANSIGVGSLRNVVSALDPTRDETHDHTVDFGYQHRAT